MYLAKPSGLLIISQKTMKLVSNPEHLSKKHGPKLLIKLKRTIEALKSENSNWIMALNTTHILLCDHEIRSAAKEFPVYNQSCLIRGHKLCWKESKNGKINKIKVNYYNKSNDQNPEFKIPGSSTCPIIQGLRVVQIASGSHYKLR